MAAKPAICYEQWCYGLYLDVPQSLMPSQEWLDHVVILNWPLIGTAKCWVGDGLTEEERHVLDVGSINR